MRLGSCAIQSQHGAPAAPGMRMEQRAGCPYGGVEARPGRRADVARRIAVEQHDHFVARRVLELLDHQLPAAGGRAPVHLAQRLALLVVAHRVEVEAAWPTKQQPAAVLRAAAGLREEPFESDEPREDDDRAAAHQVIEEVGADNLKVQMDLYHCQIVEGDLAMRIRKYLGGVGHIQIAGVPERHEPDVGEINYPYLFTLLDELGYEGWIGCEYRPRGGSTPGATSAGLGWLRPWLDAVA